MMVRMVVTRRSTRLRHWRETAPALAHGAWLPAAAQACSRALLGLSAVVAPAVVTVALLWGQRPAWWNDAPAAAGPGERRRTLALAVDNGAWTVFTQVRPMARSEGVPVGQHATSDPWSVSLSGDSATAWLNEKLPRWLDAQGAAPPSALPLGAELRAGFEPGVIHLGVRVPEPAGDRFVTISIRPRMDERGLWLPAAGVTLGRLSVPLSAVLARDGGGLHDVLRGVSPALPGGSLRLPDGRRVRLVRFEPVEGHLVMTMRTEAGR